MTTQTKPELNQDELELMVNSLKAVESSVSKATDNKPWCNWAK